MNYHNQLTYALLSTPSFLFLSLLLYSFVDMVPFPYGHIVWGIGGLILFYATRILYRGLVEKAADNHRSPGLKAIIYVFLQVVMIAMIVVGIYLSLTKPG